MELDQWFKTIKQIGKGTYGEVFKVFDWKLNKVMALKRYNKISGDSNELEVNQIREISILKSLNHQNIIKINEVIF